ncbi:hypothetical protein XVE_0552 [Xanthomonas vesicatoria ATCC 35937]|uniref:Uncharacterized protein n=1 Tax=Xanthomonas vesicatoria ATCC 35937 TaxID=925775 RepID=F0B936_9XANT|nr:hypothetical protein XVE_0552 [Xanthomonas vesicatoria ATCC 35937]
MGAFYRPRMSQLADDGAAVRTGGCRGGHGSRLLGG